MTQTQAESWANAGHGGHSNNNQDETKANSEPGTRKGVRSSLGPALCQQLTASLGHFRQSELKHVPNGMPAAHWKATKEIVPRERGGVLGNKHALLSRKGKTPFYWTVWMNSDPGFGGQRHQHDYRQHKRQGQPHREMSVVGLWPLYKTERGRDPRNLAGVLREQPSQNLNRLKTSNSTLDGAHLQSFLILKPFAETPARLACRSCHAISTDFTTIAPACPA